MNARADGASKMWKSPWVHNLKRWLEWWLPLFLVSLLPMVANFLSNRYQVSVQDLITPLIVSALTAVVVAVVFYRYSKRDRLGALAAAAPVTLVFSSNFNNRLTLVTPVFQALNPFGLGGLEGTIFSIIFAVIVLVLATVFGRVVSAVVRKHSWKAGDIATAIVIAIVAASGFQLLALGSDLISEWPQFFYHPPKLAAAPAAAKMAAKPDIYYIVLEDYASQDVLQKQFGFDNSGFMNYLKANQYVVNPSAKINYPYTTMSVASTLTAGYLNDLISHFSHSSKQTVVPFNETTRNSPVAQALQSIGYRYLLIGNWYEAFNLSRVANDATETNGILTIMNHRFILNNFPKIFLVNSIFGPLVQMGIEIGSFHVLGYQNQGDIDLAHSQLAKLRALAAEPAGGRFIMADILVPHEPPFDFNADGSLNPNPNGDNVGEPLKQKYVNSVQYINSQIKTVLDEINTNSHGKAVVVLISDEGPQLLQEDESSNDLSTDSDELESGNMAEWSSSNLQLKYGTLSAVRLPGVDAFAVTPNTMSSVNIFRLVLDSYFGYKLPYLPACYYAYPDGRDKPITFTNINKQLTGQAADARCQENGSVSGQ